MMPTTLPQYRTSRPHTWVTGPDPKRREQRVAWLRAGAQCRYRKEEWLVSFDDWVEFWGDDWERRGRGDGCLRMTRLDWRLPWRLDNMAKMPQKEHNRHNHERRVL